jgi:Flp pilus assembly protein TadD
VLRRVLEINPENGPALNFLGYSLAERGENLEEAEQLIRRALEITPNDGFFVDSLGWVYFQRGDYGAAVRELERAAKLAGSDPVISEHLADAYVKVGRTEDAIRAYRDCEARTEDPEQRQRVLDKMLKLEGRAESAASGI